jgi:hypothetical protein
MSVAIITIYTSWVCRIPENNCLEYTPLHTHGISQRQTTGVPMLVARVLHQNDSILGQTRGNRRAIPGTYARDSVEAWTLSCFSQQRTWKLLSSEIWRPVIWQKLLPKRLFPSSDYSRRQHSSVETFNAWNDNAASLSLLTILCSGMWRFVVGAHFYIEDGGCIFLRSFDPKAQGPRDGRGEPRDWRGTIGGGDILWTFLFAVK